MIPSFDLIRLLKTVFRPEGGERWGVFIDLDDPRDVIEEKFLAGRDNTIQGHAHRIFFRGLETRGSEIGAAPEVGFWAYEQVGGSNLDLPPTVFDRNGTEANLIEDVLPNLDRVLYIGRYSATAPITAIAKRMGFSGATMHGMNQTIIDTGLAVDYEAVSARAERLRSGLSGADSMRFDFEVEGSPMTLELGLAGQEAQKSHGLCRAKGEIANLPAGEVYYLPEKSHGEFPFHLDDGSLVALRVEDNRIVGGRMLRGDQSALDAHLARIDSDPMMGVLGELGLGTQELPFCGRDIQDEKIFGTFHVATGRNDHLTGTLGPDQFRDPKNASHDDILFAPHKTNDVAVPAVTVRKDGEEFVIIRNYQPTEEYVRLAAE